ncbi:ATP synthase subunit I [Tolumonas lignilytica]|jgi:F0F1-type ATP synthase, subunit I|uniref:ATP synthase subunit I n=1 Tax=Tolumonas lignilytica TaxID=1283284 RepID=UPI0004678992|nr:ATP synthase subunit I [Tolumonas lignilytica]
MLPRPAMSVKTMAWSVLAIQFVLIVVGALITWLVKDATAAGSVLSGGGTYWVPQLLFSVISTSRPDRELDVGLVLWDIYLAAGSKLITTLVCFVVVFKWLHVNHAIVLITFGLMLVSQWIISLTLNNRY